MLVDYLPPEGIVRVRNGPKPRVETPSPRAPVVTLPSCANCGGYAVLHDGRCLTCELRVMGETEPYIPFSETRRERDRRAMLSRIWFSVYQRQREGQGHG